MKKLILTGLSFLFALSLTFAQEGTPEEKAKATVEKLTEKLTLTSEQQSAIYDVVLEHKQAKAALKADTTLSADAMDQQKASLKASADAKIAEQLSDEQKPLFTKFVEERDAK
ncbi:hypothetical protein HP439_08375 [Sphingobacterium shayense]|uniref:hypothetical protein n=1 Tax=Sphingobacterium shayense TaxID=626343 RepID=UPI001552D53A|nr:hypothetical protein [Sphingobacterium shayense]NQD70731.1 hypothetical protein [Sphingobacterium shayense]